MGCRRVLVEGECGRMMKARFQDDLVSFDLTNHLLTNQQKKWKDKIKTNKQTKQQVVELVAKTSLVKSDLGKWTLTKLSM